MLAGPFLQDDEVPCAIPVFFVLESDLQLAIRTKKEIELLWHLVTPGDRE